MYLIAHLTNVTADPEIVFAIATTDSAGEWHTTSGERVWPFHVQELEEPEVVVPEGWIDYLHTEAAKFAASNRPRSDPKAGHNLLERLGLLRKQEPMRRL